MGDGTIGYATAFIGGLLSFLSPCVLPLLPGYLSFMSGLSQAELADAEQRSAWRILVPASLFALGFSTVFVLIGGAAGFASETLGPALGRYDTVLTVTAGVLVALVGVFLLGVIKVPWLYGEARFEMGKARRFGRGAAFVMGLAFGFGWTPCVGPILAVIIGMAAQTGDALRAASMLAVYSAGLALPFLLTAVFFGRLTTALTWFKRHSLTISRAAGVILIAMGILMATGLLGRLSYALIRAFPFLSTIG